MLRIENIADLDTARQVAQLLEKENARLHKRLAAMAKEVAALRGEEGHKQYELEIVRLQEQMAALQRKLFAASSEKQRRPASKPASARRPRLPMRHASRKSCRLNWSHTSCTARI